MQFEKNYKFKLYPIGWGQAQPQDICKLLDNATTAFYKNLDINLLSEKKVNVLNSKFRIPQKDNPEIIFGENNIIYLNVSDRLWSKYSYQFAHELCHHVIDNKFPPDNDKFGWFEESLCELASIYCLDEMSTMWKTNAPYPNWKDYSDSLRQYVQSILDKPENAISTDFISWLSENLGSLSEDRYKRDENRIVAIRLLPLFKANPRLWSAIQYLKSIPVTAEMTFEKFIDCWIQLCPENLKGLLLELKTSLIG